MPEQTIETVAQWKKANPKPRKSRFGRSKKGKAEFAAAKEKWHAELVAFRNTLRARNDVIGPIARKAQEYVLAAAQRALPGEKKREAAITEMLKAIDRGLEFPDTMVGKLAELGTDWFIYHPLRAKVERLVDGAYLQLRRAQHPDIVGE